MLFEALQRHLDHDLERVRHPLHAFEDFFNDLYVLDRVVQLSPQAGAAICLARTKQTAESAGLEFVAEETDHRKQLCRMRDRPSSNLC